MLRLIFGAVYGYERDAQERIQVIMEKQLRRAVPPIPAANKARIPSVCEHCLQNTAWLLQGVQNQFPECDSCKTDRIKKGLDQELQDRAGHLALN